ncbi:MAG TPA: adenylate/guanylate cyclase domain-containing protein, partial [Acidimicrobiia bacterium]
MTTSGLIAILFTDLVGSTELASGIGDAAADELRREHFASLREALAATGGTEVKTIGDALMVSYPGAADALAGAVAMQRAVERHNRRLEGQRLEMRVGISVGDATLEDDDWFGTPVVEASRLCAAATGDQILVSDLVRALAGSRTEFDVISLGSRELKGLPAPLMVCEVEWRAPVDSTSVPLPPFVDTSPAFPFAGRNEVYETVLAAWKETVEGARQAVLVSGEPGIGKTRLVSELVRYAHQHGTTVLWGRCDEELSVPFEPFAEALRHYVACVPADRVKAEIGSLGGELTRMLPDLSARVSGLALPVQTDPETERHRLFEAVCDFFAAMSHTDPVILVLDDIHWADKPSLLMLRHILRSGSPMRLFVLATYRDTDLDRTHPLADVLADLRRQAGVDRVDLGGLGPAEV